MVHNVGADCPCAALLDTYCLFLPCATPPSCATWVCMRGGHSTAPAALCYRLLPMLRGRGTLPSPASRAFPTLRPPCLLPSIVTHNYGSPCRDTPHECRACVAHDAGWVVCVMVPANRQSLASGPEPCPWPRRVCCHRLLSVFTVVCVYLLRRRWMRRRRCVPGRARGRR